MNIELSGEKNREFFNKKINEYDKTHETYMNTKKELTNNLPKNVTNILDLGAGTGLELIELFKKFPNANVTVIDISEKMLEKLKERDFSDKVKTICGNFFSVDFGKDYDAVISTSALHHFLLKDKIVLYKKIYDSLKDDGIFINSDKVALTNQEELDKIEFYNKYVDELPHIDTPLSISHEEEILKEVGFKNIITREVDKEDYRLFIANK